MTATATIAVSRRQEPLLAREMADERSVEMAGRFVTGIHDEDHHPSRILLTRSKGHHRLGELYTEMRERDLHLEGLLGKRIDAVLSLPRRVEPGDESPRAAEAAALCEAVMKTGPFKKMLRHQLEALFHGVAFDEVIWGRHDRGVLSGALAPVEIKPRPMWRFAFRKNGVLHARRVSGKPVPIPAAKVMVRNCGCSDSPWGEPLADRIYWEWFAGLHSKTYWAEHLLRFASPTSAAKYKAGKAQDPADQSQQDQALDLAEAVHSGQALSYPDGIEIALIEATRGGNASYAQFEQGCKRAKSLAILGEVSTSGDRPGVGAFASEKVADDIRFEKVVLDVDDIEDHVSCTIFDWITQLNFGPDVATSLFRIDIEGAEDRESRRSGIEAALNEGQPVPARQARHAWQIRAPRSGEEVIRRSKSEEASNE